MKGVPPTPGWKQQLQPLLAKMEADENHLRSETSSEREFVYVIDLDHTQDRERLVVEIAQRERKVDGSWGKLKTRRMQAREINSLPNPADKRILAILLGAREDLTYRYSSYYYDTAPFSYVVSSSLWDVVLPLMCATERCVLRGTSTAGEAKPLQWDDGEPWEFYLRIAPDDGVERYCVTGILRRQESEMGLAQPDLLLAGGLVFYDGRAARLEDFGAFDWISLLRRNELLSIPKSEAEDFLPELLRLANLPKLELPEELRFEEVSCPPKPCLIVKPGNRHLSSPARLVGELSFDYDGEIVAYQRSGRGIYQKARRRLVRRDLESEIAAEQRLKQLGFRRPYWTAADADFELSPDRLPKVVRALVNESWRVEAEGKLYRTPSAIRIEVKSGVDWFELEGGARFGDAAVALPKLLRALKHGEQTVRLDDGTLGILPEEWIKKYGLLAGLGSVQGNHLRFTRQQVGLLDALLASEPEVSADAIFEQARQELESFAGVRAVDAPEEFSGRLRDYQREGLGWLGFLQRFGFGGCLADDMGLGKTVQVLALLDRQARKSSSE